MSLSARKVLLFRLSARGFATAMAVVAMCGAVGGCGSTQTSSDQGAAAPSGSPETAGPAAAAKIEPCSLLSPEDISALLGKTVAGKPTGGQNPNGCLWEEPASYESVTIEIGPPESAVNNVLPAPAPGDPEVGTPGPDGMRYLGGGSVEFAAAGRNNMVQVAVLSMSSDQANAAAVGLARKIGPQLPK